MLTNEEMDFIDGAITLYGNMQYQMDLFLSKSLVSRNFTIVLNLTLLIA